MQTARKNHSSVLFVIVHGNQRVSIAIGETGTDVMMSAVSSFAP